jgi:flavin reductase (DIM6/NTAB) family NADH-FMN oxidoreductase RutF
VPVSRVAEAFHDIAADLDYPMVIVTTTDGSKRAGCLVGFVSQCSIDPLLLMVWMSKRNRTTRVAEKASGLLVHFPSRDEHELAVLFGSQTGDEVDKFARCRWEPGPDALPLLTDCSRWVAGRIVKRLDSGDHVGHLLALFEGAAGTSAGQLGFQSMKDVQPGHQP